MERPLLAMLPVHNEARRYLKAVLNRLSEFVHGIVILDDTSTDETPEICLNHPKVIGYRRLDQPLFCSDEAALRRILWEMTIKLEPEWICALDADEIFESRIIKELPDLTNQTRYDLIFFPVYHFWGDLTHYRSDGFWNPNLSKAPCLHRIREKFDFHWPNRKLHCGRFPVECFQRPCMISTVRLFHLGYVNEAEHLIKYRRYQTLDPKGEFCPSAHYHSIITPPVLKQWTGERLSDIL